MHPILPIHSYHLREDIVQIWCIQLPRNHQTVRFEKLQQLKSKRREILIQILQKYSIHPPNILENSSGKPYITNAKLQFNMSHSKELMIIAIHPSQPIGIDIEKIKIRDFIQFSTRFWGKDFVHENLYKKNLALLPISFFKSWTQTEAWVKQKGQTIFQFEQFIPQPHEDAYYYQNQQLINFIPKVGYMACICMPKSVIQIQIKYQDLSNSFENLEPEPFIDRT